MLKTRKSTVRLIVNTNTNEKILHEAKQNKSLQYIVFDLSWALIIVVLVVFDERDELVT